jgi:hypothetical protein
MGSPSCLPSFAHASLRKSRRSGRRDLRSRSHGHVRAVRERSRITRCGGEPADPVGAVTTQRKRIMATRKANTADTSAEAPRAPTFDLNDPVLQAIIAQAVAAALVQKQSQERANDTAKTDTALVKAFEKAGYKKHNVV